MQKSWWMNQSVVSPGKEHFKRGSRIFQCVLLIMFHLYYCSHIAILLLYSHARKSWLCHKQLDHFHEEEKKNYNVLSLLRRGCHLYSVASWDIQWKNVHQQNSDGTVFWANFILTSTHHNQYSVFITVTCTTGWHCLILVTLENRLFCSILFYSLQFEPFWWRDY